MNFLEQLLSEWYEYKGYFVKTNIRIQKRKTGGYKGEMDVIAYEPKRKELIHIEVSGDAGSWDDRKKRIVKKFKTAEKSYKDIFPFEYLKREQIVIVGISRPRKKVDFGSNIIIKSFKEQLAEIYHELEETNPNQKAVPEKYPIIRAIQCTIWFRPKD